MSEKLIKLNDKITMHDKLAIDDLRSGRFGDTLINMFVEDEDGIVLKKYKNLIVLRGRTFALEKLYNSEIDDSLYGGTYKKNLNRKICLFKVGQGGADIAATPFNPVLPVFSDEDLTTPVPFVIVDPDKMAVQEKADNPSIFASALTGELATKYFNPVQTDVNGTTVSSYYLKTFEAEPEWFIDKVNNEVYKKIILKLDVFDVRERYINELGLYIAEYDSVNKVYKDVEMISRLTFDTESMSSLTKTIKFEYYTYA